MPSFRAIIKDQNGNVIANRRVLATHESGITSIGGTDSNGLFEIDPNDISPGRWTVVVGDIAGYDGTFSPIDILVPTHTDGGWLEMENAQSAPGPDAGQIKVYSLGDEPFFEAATGGERLLVTSGYSPENVPTDNVIDAITDEFDTDPLATWTEFGAGDIDFTYDSANKELLFVKNGDPSPDNTHLTVLTLPIPAAQQTGTDLTVAIAGYVDMSYISGTAKKAPFGVAFMVNGTPASPGADGWKGGALASDRANYGQHLYVTSGYTSTATNVSQLHRVDDGGDDFSESFYIMAQYDRTANRINCLGSREGFAWAHANTSSADGDETANPTHIAMVFNNYISSEVPAISGGIRWVRSFDTLTTNVGVIL